MGTNQKRYIVILDRRHDRKLDELAERSRKSRSQIVRDAIDRMTGPIVDVEIEVETRRRG